MLLRNLAFGAIAAGCQPHTKKFEVWAQRLSSQTAEHLHLMHAQRQEPLLRESGSKERRSEQVPSC
jgi:hypothetical protein